MGARRSFAAAVGVAGVVAVAAWAGGAIAQEKKSVAVTAIVEHPALDAARDGIQDELAAEGYVVGKNLDFRLRERAGQSGDRGADRAASSSATRPT